MNKEKGFSLAEVLVALSLFSILIVASNAPFMIINRLMIQNNVRYRLMKVAQEIVEEIKGAHLIYLNENLFVNLEDLMGEKMEFTRSGSHISIVSSMVKEESKLMKVIVKASCEKNIDFYTIAYYMKAPRILPNGFYEEIPIDLSSFH